MPINWLLDHFNNNTMTILHINRIEVTCKLDKSNFD